MSTQSRSGYARKQVSKTDRSSFEDDSRPCIRVYNEDQLPQKRNHSQDLSSDMKPDFVEDTFSKHLKKLNEIFNSAILPTSAPEIVNSKTEEMLEIQTQSPIELVKEVVTEIDKANKLTISQIKVLEKYGIEWNVDPWKYEPKSRSSSYSHRNSKRDFRSRHQRAFSARFVRRFDEVNIEELAAETPKTRKPWGLFKGFVIKKLASVVSIKKDLVAQARLYQSTN